MEMPKLDKTKLAITSIDDEASADRAYWHGRTPHERLQAVELLRRINYGERDVSARLQRLLTVAERE